MPLINSLDSGFEDHITAMEEFSQAAADAACLAAQRKWYMPPLNGWSGDPLDIQGMNLAFDRTALNVDYESVVSAGDTGAIGETMVLKLQLDYIASLERAFRTRHMSSVRARMHASARRAGQGATNGVFGGSVTTWLQRMLEAAHSDPYA